MTDTQVIQQPTLGDIIQVEPRLEAVLRRAEAIHDGGGPCFCARALFYGWGRFRHNCFRQQIELLVGFRRAPHWGGPDWLFSLDAYNAVRDAIFQAMPPCRNCICQGGMVYYIGDHLEGVAERPARCLTTTA